MPDPALSFSLSSPSHRDVKHPCFCCCFPLHGDALSSHSSSSARMLLQQTPQSTALFSTYAIKEKRARGQPVDWCSLVSAAPSEGSSLGWLGEKHGMPPPGSHIG